jgi:hypothetical protein
MVSEVMDRGELRIWHRQDRIRKWLRFLRGRGCHRRLLRRRSMDHLLWTRRVGGNCMLCSRDQERARNTTDNDRGQSARHLKLHSVSPM